MYVCKLQTKSVKFAACFHSQAQFPVGLPVVYTESLKTLIDNSQVGNEALMITL